MNVGVGSWVDVNLDDIGIYGRVMQWNGKNKMKKTKNKNDMKTKWNEDKNE